LAPGGISRSGRGRPLEPGGAAGEGFLYFRPHPTP